MDSSGSDGDRVDFIISAVQWGPMGFCRGFGRLLEGSMACLQDGFNYGFYEGFGKDSSWFRSVVQNRGRVCNFAVIVKSSSGCHKGLSRLQSGAAGPKVYKRFCFMRIDLMICFFSGM